MAAKASHTWATPSVVAVFEEGVSSEESLDSRVVVTIEIKGTAHGIQVMLHHFLPKDVWMEITDIIDKMNGTWIASEGVWRLPSIQRIDGAQGYEEAA